MAEQLASGRSVKPDRASVRDVRVSRVQQLSSGFVRVTLESTDPGFADEFDHLGYDQWFRLFLPNHNGILEPPYGGADGWYGRWNAIEPERRPVIRNYTIRAARRSASRWELDVDFVLHRSPSGAVEGVAAGWAQDARPGDRAAILDQGRIFHPGWNTEDGPPADQQPILIIADESGLPGVEGILRSLGDRPATCLLEVPDSDDRRELCTAGSIRWLVRGRDRHPGDALLPALDQTAVDPAGYAYIVGEGSFMLAARQRLRTAGMGKDQLDFCAYWRRPKQTAGRG